jgi:protein-arginine kinase activator protein McsA
MDIIFFNDEFNKKIVLCPNCKKEFQAGIDDTEFFCEECGENFEVEQLNSFSEDFVWHPSEEY